MFNALTGGNQRVANYPGVTVERKEGVAQHADALLHIHDLPGTYSLTSASDDERVTRDALLRQRPDVVLDVVDACNPERHLYLGAQLLELGVPVVFAFNMADMARAQGAEHDTALLSKLLGGPVIPTVANRGEGIRELLDAVVQSAGAPRGRTPISYGPETDALIEDLSKKLEASTPPLLPEHWPPPRWIALKLLEGDRDLTARHATTPELKSAVASARAGISKQSGEDAALLISDRRYGWVSGACQETVRETAEGRRTRSDQMDAVLTHPVLGIPLFLMLMYFVFLITFRLGAPPMAALEHFFSWASDAILAAWPEEHWGLMRSLVVDGVIAGVGGVLAFVPNIVLLFMAIAILEDTGYMARAAFVMDRLMHKIGLHGKSFIPLLIGFGCTVPAIMATRTIENRRDRLTTMLVLPLISCGARLPIYTLLIPAFFGEPWRAPVLWLLYLIGIVLALAGARLLRKTLLRGDSEPLVMELPPFRRPTLRAVALHMLQRGGLYIRKAGTLILAISIVLWALTVFPRLPEERAASLTPADARSAALFHSAAGRLGHWIEPALKPMGMDWRAGTALIGACTAKEVFIAQLGIIFTAANEKGEISEQETASLRERVRAAYTPLQGFCMMLFLLIATPCMATIAVTRRESGSWRWAALQFGGLTVLGWLAATGVYQILR